MDLCKKCDIVFDGGDCPLCQAKVDIEDMEAKLTRAKEQMMIYLNDEISTQKDNIRSLEDEISILTNRIAELN